MSFINFFNLININFETKIIILIIKFNYLIRHEQIKEFRYING